MQGIQGVQQRVAPPASLRLASTSAWRRSSKSRSRAHTTVTAAAFIPRLPIPVLGSTANGTQAIGTASTAPEKLQIAAPRLPIPPILSCAGGGIFFFWELGAVKYLQEHYSLDQVELIGCSAGALVAVLLACGVSPDRALRSAFRLSVENDIWSRKGGLAGIWGGLIRAWLDELLPGDAGERCSGRVRLIATEVPKLGLKYLESFETKQDVIDACMASVHIPFFLDGNASFYLNGQRYIDGSLWDFLSGDNSALIKCDGAACIIDYFFDDQLQYNRLDFIKLAQFEEVQALMGAGYDWARRTDADGGFEPTLGSVRKGTVRRWVEYPVLQLSRALT